MSRLLQDVFNRAADKRLSVKHRQKHVEDTLSEKRERKTDTSIVRSLEMVDTVNLTLHKMV